MASSRSAGEVSTHKQVNWQVQVVWLVDTMSLTMVMLILTRLYWLCRVLVVCCWIVLVAAVGITRVYLPLSLCFLLPLSLSRLCCGCRCRCVPIMWWWRWYLSTLLFLSLSMIVNASTFENCTIKLLNAPVQDGTGPASGTCTAMSASGRWGSSAVHSTTSLAKPKHFLWQAW